MQCLALMTVIDDDTVPITKYLKAIHYSSFPRENALWAMHSQSHCKPKENASVYFLITDYQASANNTKRLNISSRSLEQLILVLISLVRNK